MAQTDGQLSEALRERVFFRVQDEVDFALAVQGHVLAAMARYGGEAHRFESLAHCDWIRRRVFDEFEAIGAHRVVPQ